LAVTRNAPLTIGLSMRNLTPRFQWSHQLIGDQFHPTVSSNSRRLRLADRERGWPPGSSISSKQDIIFRPDPVISSILGKNANQHTAEGDSW